MALTERQRYFISSTFSFSPFSPRSSVQSFPTHLQEHLTARVPSHITVTSSLYPTYKSVKPISHATRNLLAWLATQPPSNVILIGHSLGGLLAADAATVTSSRLTNTRHRIIGVIAFDVPYLGMHPHVVVTGIASLFPDDDDDKDQKTEKELNTHGNVNFVDPNVTDDWDAYRRGLSPSPSSNSLSTPPLSQSSGSLPSPLSSPPSTPFFQRTVDFISSHSDDSVVRWMRKHADDPFTASKNFVVERFQFGSCMFNPSDLRSRYTRLVKWDGPWVNYWTSTVPRRKDKPGEIVEPTESRESTPDVDNEMALAQMGVMDISASSDNGSSITTPDEEKKAAKKREKLLKQAAKERKALEKAQAKKEKEGIIPARHFVVLPNGLGSILGGMEHWEKVIIGGVEDEVQAHCGLFIPDQNLEYEAFTERVGSKVMEFIQRM